ncbi:Oleate-activated transcription factor 1 [Wickerhamomyces ciferrii]|uniref:Oleate-activated transcription factor 1 n=1 Tax=Wickerhamomyces ciferrii (strain ATCC 14091 / BCRC 22168 / CBS 111 / JCM 3599 / NBRC 0793 / NRRL Y-1031 F-60-10) TaxID=1206466 RepID=K0KFB1_WICCF|nr:Oleate-activated transcription factor 1 [Wickerhamomyces ciferrii]CCH41636.1 Oleate-activated transcription factor 1 [Wickerhamomyces ciferrii]
MVPDHINGPPSFQWNGFRPSQPKQSGEPVESFPNISTSDPLSNTMSSTAADIPQPQAHVIHSPVNSISHATDYHSPTSTSSSFSQQYSHNANWLYGSGAQITAVGHPVHEYPLDAQHSSSSFDDIGTTLSHDTIRSATESSYTSMSSPDSLLEGSSPQSHGHSDSTPKSHRYSTGKTKRSRMGCLTCRHRKKRCCESRPRCTECNRLGLKCTWPVPGLEHRNRPKNAKINDDLHYDSFYGHIKILRGIVEYRVNAA